MFAVANQEERGSVARDDGVGGERGEDLRCRVVGDGVAGGVSKVGEVQGAGAGVADEPGDWEAPAGMGTEGFGEMDRCGGATFGKDVEKDVGAENGGVGDSGDGGEEGAALFAGSAVSEVVDGSCDDHYGAGGEHGGVAQDVLGDVFAVGAGPGEEKDEIGLSEGDSGG